MPVTVDDEIAASRIYASAVLGTAYAELGSARSAIASIQGININGAPKIDIKAPTPVAVTAPPQYFGSRYTAQTFDASNRPRLLNLPSLIYPEAPIQPTVDLTYTAPNPPTSEPNASILGTVPTTTNITVPTAPDLGSEIRGIIAPTITPIVIPNAPTYLEPQFDGTKPTLNLSAPTGLDATFRSNYATINPVMVSSITTAVDAKIAQWFPGFSSGLAALESRLNAYLAGGTAIDAVSQNAISRRALDKNNTDANREMAALLKRSAAAGQVMFSPVLLSQMRDVSQARRDNNARAETEITVKLFELEQQNVQFAVTQSNQLRQSMIQAELAMVGHLVQVNGQAIEYARDVVDAIVKAYDIAARYAEIQARLYEADARVYEAKLKGAMAAIDAWTARVRGLEAQANVDTARVNAYRARIEAVQAEANVYKAQVEGITAQASIERLKVDIYQARTQAYGAQVNAYTAQWQGYKAAVEGQTAKIGAGAEQYRVYGIQVEAQVKQIQARIAELQGVASGNESLVRMYSADVEAFRAKVSAESTAVAAEVASYDTTLKGFVANWQAVAEHSRAEISSYETGLRALIESAKIFQQYALTNSQIGIQRATGMAGVGEKIGSIYGQVAMSALAGANTLVSKSSTG